ncbi:hypothetical protein BLNAU_14552 [Blattamonas nauphoetae]|uniref:E3 ubiquitin-protein ligase n=1 Tax=Blattamonas nauphoetae TaxID=2049346 RepID=A0ABQ9XDJ4_9EUKA|nr:hypothetical protein BLNAU_14552 [Blattamonas nauphoetae]
MSPTRVHQIVALFNAPSLPGCVQTSLPTLKHIIIAAFLSQILSLHAVYESSRLIHSISLVMKENKDLNKSQPQNRHESGHNTQVSSGLITVETDLQNIASFPSCLSSTHIISKLVNSPLFSTSISPQNAHDTISTPTTNKRRILPSDNISLQSTSSPYPSAYRGASSSLYHPSASLNSQHEIRSTSSRLRSSTRTTNIYSTHWNITSSPNYRFFSIKFRLSIQKRKSKHNESTNSVKSRAIHLPILTCDRTTSKYLIIINFNSINTLQRHVSIHNANGCPSIRKIIIYSSTKRHCRTTHHSSLIYPLITPKFAEKVTGPILDENNQVLGTGREESEHEDIGKAVDPVKSKALAKDDSPDRIHSPSSLLRFIMVFSRLVPSSSFGAFLKLGSIPALSTSFRDAFIESLPNLLLPLPSPPLFVSFLSSSLASLQREEDRLRERQERMQGSPIVQRPIATPSTNDAIHLPHTLVGSVQPPARQLSTTASISPHSPQEQQVSPSLMSKSASIHSSSVTITPILSTSTPQTPPFNTNSPMQPNEKSIHSVAIQANFSPTFSPTHQISGTGNQTPALTKRRPPPQRVFESLFFSPLSEDVVKFSRDVFDTSKDLSFDISLFFISSLPPLLSGVASPLTQPLVVTTLVLSCLSSLLSPHSKPSLTFLLSHLHRIGLSSATNSIQRRDLILFADSVQSAQERTKGLLKESTPTRTQSLQRQDSSCFVEQDTISPESMIKDDPPSSTSQQSTQSSLPPISPTTPRRKPSLTSSFSTSPQQKHVRFQPMKLEQCATHSLPTDTPVLDHHSFSSSFDMFSLLFSIYTRLLRNPKFLAALIVSSSSEAAKVESTSARASPTTSPSSPNRQSSGQQTILASFLTLFTPFQSALPLIRILSPQPFLDSTLLTSHPSFPHLASFLLRVVNPFFTIAQRSHKPSHKHPNSRSQIKSITTIIKQLVLTIVTRLLSLSPLTNTLIFRPDRYETSDSLVQTIHQRGTSTGFPIINVSPPPSPLPQDTNVTNGVFPGLSPIQTESGHAEKERRFDLTPVHSPTILSHSATSPSVVLSQSQSHSSSPPQRLVSVSPSISMIPHSPSLIVDIAWNDVPLLLQLHLQQTTAKEQQGHFGEDIVQSVEGVVLNKDTTLFYSILRQAMRVDNDQRLGTEGLERDLKSYLYSPIPGRNFLSAPSPSLSSQSLVPISSSRSPQNGPADHFEFNPMISSLATPSVRHKRQLTLPLTPQTDPLPHSENEEEGKGALALGGIPKPSSTESKGRVKFDTSGMETLPHPSTLPPSSLKAIPHISQTLHSITPPSPVFQPKFTTHAQNVPPVSPFVGFASQPIPSFHLSSSSVSLSPSATLPLSGSSMDTSMMFHLNPNSSLSISSLSTSSSLPLAQADSASSVVMEDISVPATPKAPHKFVPRPPLLSSTSSLNLFSPSLLPPSNAGPPSPTLMMSTPLSPNTPLDGTQLMSSEETNVGQLKMFVLAILTRRLHFEHPPSISLPLHRILSLFASAFMSHYFPSDTSMSSFSSLFSFHDALLLAQQPLVLQSFISQVHLGVWNWNGGVKELVDKTIFSPSNFSSCLVPDLFLLQICACVAGWDSFLTLALSTFQLDFFFIPTWSSLVGSISSSSSSLSAQLTSASGANLPLPTNLSRVGVNWNLNDTHSFLYATTFFDLLNSISSDRTMPFQSKQDSDTMEHFLSPSREALKTHIASLLAVKEHTLSSLLGALGALYCGSQLDDADQPIDEGSFEQVSPIADSEWRNLDQIRDVLSEIAVIEKGRNGIVRLNEKGWESVSLYHPLVSPSNRHLLNANIIARVSEMDDPSLPLSQDTLNPFQLVASLHLIGFPIPPSPHPLLSTITTISSSTVFLGLVWSVLSLFTHPELSHHSTASIPQTPLLNRHLLSHSSLALTTQTPIQAEEAHTVTPLNPSRATKALLQSVLSLLLISLASPFVDGREESENSFGFVRLEHNRIELVPLKNNTSHYLALPLPPNSTLVDALVHNPSSFSEKRNAASSRTAPLHFQTTPKKSHQSSDLPSIVEMLIELSDDTNTNCSLLSSAVLSMVESIVDYSTLEDERKVQLKKLLVRDKKGAEETQLVNDIDLLEENVAEHDQAGNGENEEEKEETKLVCACCGKPMSVEDDVGQLSQICFSSLLAELEHTSTDKPHPHNVSRHSRVVNGTDETEHHHESDEISSTSDISPSSSLPLDASRTPPLLSRKHHKPHIDSHHSLSHEGKRPKKESEASDSITWKRDIELGDDDSSPSPTKFDLPALQTTIRTESYDIEGFEGEDELEEGMVSGEVVEKGRRRRKRNEKTPQEVIDKTTARLLERIKMKETTQPLIEWEDQNWITTALEEEKMDKDENLDGGLPFSFPEQSHPRSNKSSLQKSFTLSTCGHLIHSSCFLSLLSSSSDVVSSSNHEKGLVFSCPICSSLCNVVIPSKIHESNSTETKEAKSSSESVRRSFASNSIDLSGTSDPNPLSTIKNRLLEMINLKQEKEKPTTHSLSFAILISHLLRLTGIAPSIPNWIFQSSLIEDEANTEIFTQLLTSPHASLSLIQTSTSISSSFLRLPPSLSPTLPLPSIIEQLDKLFVQFGMIEVNIEKEGTRQLNNDENEARMAELFSLLEGVVGLFETNDGQPVTRSTIHALLLSNPSFVPFFLISWLMSSFVNSVEFSLRPVPLHFQGLDQIFTISPTLKAHPSFSVWESLQTTPHLTHQFSLAPEQQRLVNNLIRLVVDCLHHLSAPNPSHPSQQPLISTLIDLIEVQTKVLCISSRASDCLTQLRHQTPSLSFSHPLVSSGLVLISDTVSRADVSHNTLTTTQTHLFVQNVACLHYLDEFSEGASHPTKAVVLAPDSFARCVHQTLPTFSRHAVSLCLSNIRHPLSSSLTAFVRSSLLLFSTLFDTTSSSFFTNLSTPVVDPSTTPPLVSPIVLHPILGNYVHDVLSFAVFSTPDFTSLSSFFHLFPPTIQHDHQTQFQLSLVPPTLCLIELVNLPLSLSALLHLLPHSDESFLTNPKSPTSTPQFSQAAQAMMGSFWICLMCGKVGTRKRTHPHSLLIPVKTLFSVYRTRFPHEQHQQSTIELKFFSTLIRRLLTS